MSGDRQQTGSFRDHLEELLTRLSHEGLIGAGTEPPKRGDRPDDWTRNPAYHNEALFNWRRD